MERFDGTVGFGAHLANLSPRAPLAERLRRNREMLSRALSSRATVVFVGAGCSAPLKYPNWKGLARIVATTLELALRASDPLRGRDVYLVRLREFQRRLDGPRAEDSRFLTFVLGGCQNIARECGLEKAYRDKVADVFSPGDTPKVVAHNPYNALLELPVDRFITSNYDSELELALAQLEEAEWDADSFGKASQRTGMRTEFTQEFQYTESLARFAIARMPGEARQVFHCHGHHSSPRSMVMTDEDYRYWYLNDSKEGVVFRQTIHLLVGSNPILFVGFSLADEDFTRSLRTLLAGDPLRRQPRPLFCLLQGETDEASEWERSEYLLQRYGVHVLPYPREDDQARALCTALKDVEACRKEWRRKWLKKPAFRRVTVNEQPDTPYRHYSVSTTGAGAYGGDRVQRMFETMRLHETPPGVLGLIGGGGTGKSWLALKLLERVCEERKYDGYFFWSSYYADDGLTGVDRALEYLDREGRMMGTRFERLVQCLRDGDKRYFLIFDGIERFLSRIDRGVDHGRATGWSVERFLASIADPASNSTVLITSRLWPDCWEEGGERPRRLEVERVQVGDVRNTPPFDQLDSDDVSALCSLLENHVYAIRLAGAYLQRRPRELPARADLLRLELSDAPRNGRVAFMVRKAIESLDEELHGIAAPFLRRLSLFMSPATESVVQVCFSLVRRKALEERGESGADLAVDQEELLAALVASHLLFRVNAPAHEDSSRLYTVHALVRGIIARKYYKSATDALPNFTLPGFTAGDATVDP